MPHIVEAWACDLCGKVMNLKSSAVRHESKYCHLNPKLKYCSTCSRDTPAECPYDENVRSFNKNQGNCDEHFSIADRIREEVERENFAYVP